MQPKLYFSSLWEKGVKSQSLVPCSPLPKTWVPVIRLFYTGHFTASKPKLLICPSPPPCPLGNHKFIPYVCESVSVL